MNQILALQCDVQRLHPHQLSDQQALVLGLNLQMVFLREGAQPTTADIAWVQSWLWEELRFCDIYFFPKDTSKPGVPLTSVPVWDLQPRPQPPLKARAALTKRVESLFTEVGPDAFLWSPTNPNAPLPDQGYVTSIQSAAARIATTPGYSLNLCAVVRIKKADLPATVVTGGMLDDETLVFLAPHLSWTVPAAQYTPNAKGPSKLDPVTGKPQVDGAGDPVRPDNRDMVGWNYGLVTANPATVPQVIAYVKPVELKSNDSEGRFIRLEKGWVRRELKDVGGAAVPMSDPGEDFSTQLASRIADRWTTAKHLIDAVRRHTAIPNFPEYWRLIASSLRDRAGLGLIDTTDGNGLLRYALQLAVPLSTDTWFENLARDGALRTLQARMIDAEAEYDLDAWLAELKNVTQLPPVLCEALQKPVNLPERKITLSWPAGNPGIPLVLAGPAPPPVSIVVYSRRDGVAGAAGGELLRIAGIVGVRETELDGSVNLTFDAYRQLAAVPLPAGFFEAIVSDGGGNPFPSARRFIPPTSADDLAPLVRLGTALGNNSVLAPLVFAGWIARATRTFSVAASAATKPWFATVVTKVADDSPTYTVSSDWVGDLRPFDGRTWIVTLGNIARAPAGTEFTLEFSGPYQPNGEPLAAAAAIILRVESLLGTPNLRLTLALKGTAQQQQNTVDVPANYHLRIELGRANALTMSAAVFAGHGENPASWLTGAPIVQLAGLAEPKLRRLGLRMLNGTAQLAAIAPTLLTAPRSLLSPGMLSLRQLWDLSMDPASQLWRQAQVPTPDAFGVNRPLAEKLLQYDLATKLARGQTARLEPVWGKQLPTADPNHRLYLQKKLVEMLRALPADRFDRTPGDKAKSIYRDFYPEASAQGINTKLWKLVLDQFASAAAISLPPVFNPTSPFQEQAADTIPTPMPHALNLEVDRPGMFTDTIADGEDADLLLNLRGFGVLLRQANPAAPADVDPAKYFANQPWQLLTAVDIGVLDAAAPANPKLEHYKPDIDFGMLSGDVPLQYQNLNRQTTITYLNRHLVAVSPLTQIAESFEFGDEDLRAQPSPFLRKKPAKLAGPAFDWGVLPTLKFGQLYQVFPFVIGNCGNMPVLLTGTNGHPARLRTTQIGDAEWDVGADKAKDQIRSLKYLRRVGIGPLRLEQVNGETSVNGKKIGLPEVPAGVRPLANEWQLQGLTYAQPEMRYAYDGSRRQGEIGVEGQKLENWVVVVPRVFVAGASDDEFAQPGINFHLEIGLRSQSSSCVLKVERQAESLKANGTEVVKLATVEQEEIFGGPLDLCVAFGNDSITGKSSLRLAWRRSDRNEPWSSSASAIIATSAIPGPAWVSITRKPATGLDPDETVTLAVPRFAAGTVDLQKFLADERLLDVRPLPAPDRAVVVFKGDAGKALTFGLRPPATDLETWTAWFDMDRVQHGAADIRLATWTFHKLWSVPASEGSPANPDSTIDDFAVNYLLVELVPLHIDSVPRANFPRALEKRLQIPWKVIRRPAGNNLDAVQSLAREFELQVKPAIDAGGTDPQIAAAYSAITPRLKDGSPILIRILEKEIWELRVYPAVREDYFSTASNKPGAQRFHSAFGESMKWNYGGTDYRLFNPWRLVLEGGTEEVVVPTTRTNNKIVDTRERQNLLLNSLQPRFAGGLLTVQQVKQHPKNYRYAAQLRLQRQVWRWLGRPTPPFPFDASTTSQLLDSSPQGELKPAELEAPSLVSLWDAAGFGARSNLDLLEEVRPIAVDQRRELLFREELNNDRRFLYYRFSQRAISRYAGLYLNPPTLQAAEAAGPGQNPWRRLMVPCRFDRDVPRPPLRFVAPLTQPEEDSAMGDVPGLLVVMDDAWYAHGGLAEALEGEIVEVADYWDTAGGNAPVKRPEFSPSPTHTGVAWTKTGVGEGASEAPPSCSLPMELVGPMGHTFDTDADAPLFNASSFVLRPPAVRGVELPDGSRESLDWYFAKVRFRRILLPEACDDYRWDTPLPITGEQTTALSLEATRTWVVEAAQAILDFDTVAAELKVTIAGTGDVILSLASAGTLTARWAPSVTGALSGQLVYRILNAPAKTKVQVDLRVLLQLDARTGDPDAPATPPPRHLIVQVRVRSVSDAASGTRLSTDKPQRVWQNVGTLTWDGVSWPSNWTLTATGNVSSTLPAAYLARVSAFTPPNWVQFLPNGELLAKLLAALRTGLPTEAPGARVPTLHWTTGAQPTRWKIFDSDGSDVTGLLPSGEPVEAATNSDIALFRCVMLTELIADVRGQFGQELYLGLFRIPKSSTEMVEVHRSVDVTTAGINRGSRPPRKLRLRAIEFEIVNLKGSDFKDRFPLAPLDFLFENVSATSTSDARARIVRTSPPVECSESPN